MKQTPRDLPENPAFSRVGRHVFRGPLAVLLCAVAGIVSGCDKIEGLEGKETPLLRIRVQTKGQLAKLVPPPETAKDVKLKAALVWGARVLPTREFCTENGLNFGKDPDVAAVYAQGCKDIFGFVPQLVQAVADVGEDGTATLELMHLPTAEVLVGTPGARIAHGSIVIFHDRDGNGTLDLRRGNHHYVCREQGGGPNGNQPSDCPPEHEGGKDGADAGSDGSGSSGRVNRGGAADLQGPPDDEEDWSPDYVYGATFQSMLGAHERITYREGDYTLGSFFYPTIGCDAPPQGFSINVVSGLPTKATCVYKKVADTVVEVALQATETVAEVACVKQNFHYHDSRRKPDLTQPYVCIDGNALIAASPPNLCKSLSAVSLRGCRANHDCEEPDWDDHEDPPDWWPCGEYVDPIEKKKREKAKEQKEQGSSGGGQGS